MKPIAIDMAYKSLNHYGEELCGDKVEIVDKEDSRILILAGKWYPGKYFSNSDVEDYCNYDVQ